MPTSFFQYEMLPATWFVLSALMILAIFFKFNRFWSVRNFDLIGLILMSPGLLFLAMYDNQLGYIYFFVAQIFILIRLIFDTVMVRRPLLDPNLMQEGLTFACIALLGFLIANVLVNRGEKFDSARTVRLEQILTLTAKEKSLHSPSLSSAPASAAPIWETNESLASGYLPFLQFTDTTNQAVGASPELLPQLELRKTRVRSSKEEKTTKPDTDFNAEINTENAESNESPSENSARQNDENQENVSLPDQLALSDPDSELESGIGEPIHKTETPSSSDSTLSTFDTIICLSTVIAAHLFIVCGLIMVGHCHFGNIRTGIAAATLYLLHHYTNQMPGRIDHFIPSALILWAVLFYRRPVFSGALLASAAALVFYPIFLFPLWFGFYWKKGAIRFLAGIVTVYLVFGILIVLGPSSYGSVGQQIIDLFGHGSFVLENPDGVWEIWKPFYRIPIIALFFVFCFGMLIWPSHKHLATLISCSTIVLLGTQFWQTHQGGLYIGWYLPLLILTIFRPNLEDRTAVSSVIDASRYF